MYRKRFKIFYLTPEAPNAGTPSWQQVPADIETCSLPPATTLHQDAVLAFPPVTPSILRKKKGHRCALLLCRIHIIMLRHGCKPEQYRASRSAGDNLDSPMGDLRLPNAARGARPPCRYHPGVIRQHTSTRPTAYHIGVCCS